VGGEGQKCAFLDCNSLLSTGDLMRFVVKLALWSSMDLHKPGLQEGLEEPGKAYFGSIV